MRFDTALSICILAVLLPMAYAFPNGAGGCAPGGAVMGQHLTGEITTGELVDGNFEVMVNGIAFGFARLTMLGLFWRPIKKTKVPGRTILK